MKTTTASNINSNNRTNVVAITSLTIICITEKRSFNVRVVVSAKPEVTKEHNTLVSNVSQVVQNSSPS